MWWTCTYTWHFGIEMTCTFSICFDIFIACLGETNCQIYYYNQEICQLVWLAVPNRIWSLIKNAPNPPDFYQIQTHIKCYSEFVIYVCVVGVYVRMNGELKQQQQQPQIRNSKAVKRHERVKMRADKKFSNLDQLAECKGTTQNENKNANPHCDKSVNWNSMFT